MSEIFSFGNNAAADFAVAKGNPTPDTLIVRPFVADISGPLLNGYMHRHTENANSNRARMAVYDSTNVLIAASAEVTLPSGELAAFPFPAGAVINAGSTYKLAFWVGSYGSLAASSSSPSWYPPKMEPAYSATGAFPDPFASTATYGSMSNLVMYATVDAGPKITINAVADATETALPALVNVNYTIHDANTGAIIGSKGTGTITDGVITIGNASMAYNTEYRVDMWMSDRSRARAFFAISSAT